MRTTARVVLAAVAVGVLGAAAALWAASSATEAEIERHRAAVIRSAAAHDPTPPAAAALAGLPEPVRRFVAFTFPGPIPTARVSEVEMSGRFRRPKAESFAPTTASQTSAADTPSFVFAATTPVLPGVWARAWDAYVDGAMSMKAKLLSAFAVVDQLSSPELDRISLRRWLLESAFYPTALLPGGPVTWEPIDARRARAVVRFRGVSASLVATFADDGRLVSFDAEADGDLETPYHGSGERVERDDYRLVDGAMIPMRFVVSRVAGGRTLPFWDGRVTAIRLSSAGR